jgi:hypothetical protein
MEAGKTSGAQAPLRNARLLHLLTSREKMVMVLASHAVTKGPAVRQPTGWAMAGLLASVDVWDSLSRRWGRGPSEALQESHLAGLLASGEIVAIVGALGAAWGRPLAPAPESVTLLRQPYDPPLRCFDHCVVEAAGRLKDRPAGEKVSFVMDWADRLAAAAMWRMEDLKNLTERPVRERLGALGFESREDFPPLLAAERLARRCEEWLEGRARQTERLEGGAIAPGIRLTLLDGGRPGGVPKVPDLARKEDRSRS